MNNKKDMQTVIQKFYGCSCNVEFLGDNNQNVIIRVNNVKDYEEVNARESKKVLSSAGFDVKFLAVIH